MGKTIFRFCRTCGFYQAQAKTCTIMAYFKGQIEPTDFCSKYTEVPVRCEFCNAIALAPYIVFDKTNKPHICCSNCLPQVEVQYAAQ